MLKRRPLSESAVVKSEAQWRMNNNVIGRPVWNRMFLTDDKRSKRRGMAMAILDERCDLRFQGQFWKFFLICEIP